MNVCFVIIKGIINSLTKFYKYLRGLFVLRNLPDFEINLREATDFIMSTYLSRKAFKESFVIELPNILRDLLEQIHLMALSCHLAEFTEHGLPHIYSVVKRISDWGENVGWIKDLEKNEATVLLLSAIVHDIGMLSQDPKDLDEDYKEIIPKGMTDVPHWVRKTHERRIRGILRRILFDEGKFSRNDIGNQIDLIAEVARAHRAKPEALYKVEFPISSPSTNKFKINRLRGICSIIAVADELDEDKERCKTQTLLSHRQGNSVNKAHWIRHGLIDKRIEIKKNDGIIQVEIHFTKPSKINDEKKFVAVYRCLQEHFKLILAYNQYLEFVDAEIPNEAIKFIPEISDINHLLEMPINPDLNKWEKDENLRYSLPENLIDTLKKKARIKAKADLDFYDKFRGTEPLTPEEMTLNAILGD